MLEHGGKLAQAAQRYGIPAETWLDLSTGINPIGWPVPALPANAWRRLPEDNDGLIDAARAYYGAAHLLAVSGSQAAIQVLPTLRATGRVGMLHPTYSEHAHAWAKQHRVISLNSNEIESKLDQLDELLLCNPNNPSGERFAPETLLTWRTRLAARGGWLVVDEAFIDAEPQLSIVRHTGAEGLIVLRSLGKFFGLAGARVGFVAAWPALLMQMQEVLGPWSINGPARAIACLALQDSSWQQHTRARLQLDSARLAALLTRHGLAPAGGTALFQWICTDRAAALHETLARQGILTRLFTKTASLRFGLPGAEDEWNRLEIALGNQT
ncbi:MAG: threonine-phosphate decarboxylase [Betaproteobacteria bacterium RBG_16_58_11]|nr:MAG: threonine-phosphate decarboxylase [Betaproteobacteria bacterium RBG_16_58_11]